MSRQKSILKRIEVNEVLHAHDCQHNKKHRLQKGDKRLKIWDDRTAENYCVTCALEIISCDIARLQEIEQQLRS